MPESLNEKKSLTLAEGCQRSFRSQEPGARSQEPGARSQEPGARSQEPGARSQEPGARSQEPGARSQEPGARSQEPGARSQEPGARSQEPGARSQEPGARSRGAAVIVPRVRRSASSRPDSQSTLAARLTHSVATLVRRSAAGALLALAALLAAPMLGIGGIAHAQTEVPTDWSLIPAGLGPGDQFRLLFVSSTTRDATSSDIADYDAHLQSAAAACHDAVLSKNTNELKTGDAGPFRWSSPCGEPQIRGVSEAMSAIRVLRTRRENTVQQRDATLPGRRPGSRSWAKMDIKEARATPGPERARPATRQ